MKIRQALVSLFFVLMTVLVVGCDSGTDDTPSETKIYAKAGSTFDFAGFEKDSSYVKIPGSDTTWRDTVTTGPIAFEGKTNVITVLRGNGDTTILAYEDNGDVSLYFPRGLDEAELPVENVGVGWWRIPLGSKDTGVVLFTARDTIPIDIFQGDVQISGVTSYVGEGTFNLNGESFATQRATVTVTVKITILGIGQTFTVTNTITIDFAPKLGYLVQQDSKQTQPPQGGNDDGGKYEVLIGYSLKK